jgi:hypothetical protein
MATGFARPILCFSRSTRIESSSHGSPPSLLPKKKSDSDDSEASLLLQQWLASQKLPPQKLSLRRVGPQQPGGRGLVASSHIRKGERLLFIPSDLVITTDTVGESPSQPFKVVLYLYWSPQSMHMHTYTYRACICMHTCMYVYVYSDASMYYVTDFCMYGNE